MIRVGTSGFSYEHWKGVFYPEDVPQRRWLEFYSGHFDCVEVNSSFYHLPKPSVVEAWRNRVPADFHFVLKGSRTVTHIKRLKDCQESVDVFYERAAALRDKLTAVLWQLPPGLHKDLGLLEEFVGWLPVKPTPVLEFRHRSWFMDDVFDMLNIRYAAFCVHDMESVNCPDIVTSPMVYVRFHGQAGRYRDDYPDEVLRSRAAWLTACGAEHGYAFFNNDIGGHAVKNARTLRQFLSQA
jgi:uncharacterized protein YecE (DUF72 family)